MGQHDGIRDRVLHRLLDVLCVVRDPVSEAAMTPFVVACLHGVVIMVEAEVAAYLIKLRRELMKVVVK
jgi:hypothetical protein